MCERASATIESPGGTTPEDYSHGMSAAAGTFDTLLKRWAQTDLPRDADEPLIRPILDALESAVFSMREVAEWVAMGELGRASEEFERLREHAAEYRVRAREYGFNFCPHVLGVQ